MRYLLLFCFFWRPNLGRLGLSERSAGCRGSELCAGASRCVCGSARSCFDSFRSSFAAGLGRVLHLTAPPFSTIRFGRQIWIPLRYDALDNYARFLAFILFLPAGGELGIEKCPGEPSGQRQVHLSVDGVPGG